MSWLSCVRWRDRAGGDRRIPAAKVRHVAASPATAVWGLWPTGPDRRWSWHTHPMPDQRSGPGNGTVPGRAGLSESTSVRPAGSKQPTSSETLDLRVVASTRWFRHGSADAVCHVNAAFYREEPAQRHVHRFGGPQAAVLTGLV